MKKSKLPILITLCLILTSCKHERFEHIATAIDGFPSTTIIMFVFAMLFVVPFLFVGIPFLISGLMHIKTTKRKGRAITGISLGASFTTLGILFSILVPNLFFNESLKHPDSQQYNTVEKALQICDSAHTEIYYRVSSRGYEKDEYLVDYDYTLRDAFAKANYKSANSIKLKGTHLSYYLPLSSSYPFCEIRIYSNGGLYVDYVEGYSRETVTYFFTTDASTAESIISLGESKHDAYRAHQKEIEDATKEAGRIETFFQERKECEVTSAYVYDENNNYCTFGFSRENLNTICDFRYVEIEPIEDSQYYTEKFVMDTGFWRFQLISRNDVDYYVILSYKVDEVRTKRAYSLRKIEGEAIYNIALEGYKSQNQAA